MAGRPAMTWNGTPAPTWITPTLLNGWTVLSGWDAPGFVKLDGWVTIHTALGTGNSVGSIMFILPSGYRPTGTVGFVVDSGGHCRINIDAAGNVYQGSGGSTAGCLLHGIRFPAAA